MVGHFPFFAGAECRDVLVIGFGIGVTTSLGHCIGMCGPLISTFSLAQGKTDHRVRNLP